MRSFGALGLVCGLVSACAGDADVAATAPRATAVAGTWAITAAAAPERAVVAGRLTLSSDRTWRLRYDYRDVGVAGDQVWSSGLSGRWEVQAGEPVAVRFEVLDDRSTAVGLLRASGTMDVALGGLTLRLARTPE
jgi:hypothetical protein